uniref:NADH-ubiquinone oxidoreductase chain 5 n=1 Tax=Pleurotus pulmonarius TaxID=28995 RepID=A0A2U8LKR4_PLEPU|nr:NADH dehydrogenase subunit 5 [Pleurotus pulmonarius]AWL21259.1 NADH dehydrogenase subunit 5 [Pleurotus pulmonarius]QBS47730.1 NADH dehydrogenase subunit 5 [Pleurotus pulmonarius]QBS47750.1 NADH dehydrogenase subunit 5 [Pleurotus pulmonarius]QCP68313.1 NADH dehydrogenase subunit 5 [Pleurotus pulmonarius]UKQ55995.1 NADH dehydrogenase subunit 5 [Pleurotus pulmonarius]
MYLSIIILPLLGSIVSGFMGRKVGITGSLFITCTCLILSSVLMTVAFYEVGLCGSPVSINLGSWIDSEIMSISWEFYFDQLTVSLGLAVLYCSSLIHIYSISYMSEDPHVQRFMSYLSAFTAGMLVLISGGNYFVMFIGWESIGVVSYLLINFYFTRIQANKASILAFTMNRVGDMGMSIGFFAIFSLFGSLNYSTIFSLSPYMNETAITIISLLLFMGAMAKSANIPFHSWLPGSMEAPTPVSALLHAATLVTAGIYLLLRSSPILEFSSTALLIITLIGATTAFFAATSGLVQNDLKRIIAFSTISQLGYMVMAVGLSQYNVALMHTVNHAFFKALLFLGAGAVIHSFADQQDIRKMGGLIKFLPFTYSVMLVGSLSLLATPFLTGFYSKDLILELAFGQYTFSGFYAYILGTITAGITAFYSFRLISLVFLTVPNGPKFNYLHSHESNLAIIIPLFILALFSILFGFVFSDLFVGVGSDFFGNSLFIHPNNISIIEAEFSLNLIIKLLPVILSLIGSVLAIYLYHNNPEFINQLTDNTISRKIYGFLNGKYYFDVIYNHYFISKGLLLGYTISKELDRGAIEFLGPYGLSTAFTNTGNNIAKLDTGIVTTYALYITLGLLSLLFVVFAPILIDVSMLSEFRLVIIYLASIILVLSFPSLNNKNS